MRRTVFASLLALAACGPVPAPSSGPTWDRDPASTPQGGAAVIASRDGFHVDLASSSHIVMHEVAAPVDRVWQVLPEVYREMGITANADASIRTVASPSASYTRRMFGEPATRFFDCGRGQFGTEFASTHTISLILRTTVQPGATPESARLETVAQAYARNNDGANSTMAQCQSKGLLEGLIALHVREKLGAPPAAGR